MPVDVGTIRFAGCGGRVRCDDEAGGDPRPLPGAVRNSRWRDSIKCNCRDCVIELTENVLRIEMPKATSDR